MAAVDKVNRSKKSNENIFEDANNLMTSVVALQLYGCNRENKKIMIWQNPHLSSSSYCRPIKFKFTKKTDQSITEEFESVRNQITSLAPPIVELDDQTYEIETDLNNGRW